MFLFIIIRRRFFSFWLIRNIPHTGRVSGIGETSSKKTGSVWIIHFIKHMSFSNCFWYFKLCCVVISKNNRPSQNSDITLSKNSRISLWYFTCTYCSREESLIVRIMKMSANVPKISSKAHGVADPHVTMHQIPFHVGLLIVKPTVLPIVIE